ncbi:hypothetical protein BKP37_04045 [Anaerobacillus alkalilacustris]|uniref:LURP-one-related family protein n=1 Tax=Anaerobacillus alkalilacustris TaxID=393763 RepID=A0A1S2LYR2_9BACI|nr:hypothetical protein [Anaerobacillus alkalilacustris]OIJ17629.1 hypothetical protein BKP37_04045 [Anaerobacillus alkalilacustris]
MSNSPIYFTDNFFSVGLTTIYNENEEQIGSLDLKSILTSSVDILDKGGKLVIKGYFPFFSRRWRITDANDKEIGTLKQRFSFLSKKYEYETQGRAVYQVESEIFSKEYKIINEHGTLVADFKRISGFFASPAFRLTNQSDKLKNEELIAVVMGVSMITKRNNASSNSANSH